MIPNRDDDLTALRCMEVCGGGFAGALATAALRADKDNYARIRNAFPELFDQFRRLVAQFPGKW